MRRLLLQVVVCVLIAGCGSRTEETKGRGSGANGGAAAPAAIVGSGIVRGKVTLAVTPPARKAIPNAHCSEDGSDIMDETVITGAGGGLKNCLVSIEGIGPGAPASQTPVLDQVNCTFVPHVIGVCVGQPLLIRSSDPTFHNVHIVGPSGDLMNLAEPSAGVEHKETFDSPGVLHAKCDIHPWMSAYIGVFENPLFAVTGDDGSFQIKGVPPGTYKLSIWHEQYGKQEKEFTVADDKPAEVDVSYGKQ